ncbi:MAG: hypothetical protein K9I59_10845 [Chlorobium sp.]|nr:hypothetical protein [Chlorobium sp.]MCF8272152.1 hypothetical protein [Chlorobium sp.]MCF8288529.1 hypothetical protein [Chlorobium sp.]MCF8292111.1 hypothetical protein [Chlorobium sp.]
MQTNAERPNESSRNRSTMLQLPICALALILLQACHSLNIESARTLAKEGRNVAAAGSSQIFVSDREFRNAAEAEVFLHAYTGADTPDQILDSYSIIMLELSKRNAVFTNLAALYAVFYDLSSNDAPARIETAVNNLGDAVNDYAATVSSAPFLSNESITIAGAIGRAAMTAKKKKMIMQSSVLIRERLNRLLQLLENPLVRQQLVTWKTNLAQNRAAVTQMLMIHGVLDTTPLLNQMGSDAGLQGAPDAAAIIRKNKRLSNGLEQVIAYRLHHNLLAIDNGYDATCEAIRELILLHENLEKGEPVTVASIRQAIAELQGIADQLNK